MSTKYWDIYVLYIERCVRENYENDIDPAHYEMEFNHFWPRSIFGDWPVGQFLTLRQHAIASALQTLVFKENCMCAWYKQYLPPKLLELSWSYFRKAASVNGKKGGEISHAEKDENGKSVNAVKAGKKGGVTNSQLWQSTMDGFIGNPGNVAQYNRARGWPGDARVRLS
jgi:hypothetical protein